MWSDNGPLQGNQKEQYDHLARLPSYVQVEGPCGSTKDGVDSIMSGVLDNWHFFQLISFTVFYLFQFSASYFLVRLS